MIPLCIIICTKPIEEPEPNSEIYEDELDELIKSMAEYSTDEYSTDEYSCIDDIGNPNNQDISNDDQPTVVDWNAVVKLTYENNKRREEETANLKIAEYKAANPSWVDRAIRRTFRVKRGGCLNVKV